MEVRMKRDEILKTLKKEGVKFLRLQFTDILGINKNVEVPPKQFEKALDGEIMFDGSSIEGFARIEESDMILVPDLNTFVVFPWEEKGGRVARLICDIYRPDGSPFEGCTRNALKKIVERVKKAGYTPMAGTEMEFFLFQTDSEGKPTTNTHDDAGYFDMTPVDKGEEARRAMINVLEGMGFEVEAGHHEVARGQHEIDFKYDEFIKTADNICTLKIIVRKVAQDFNLHATFMPKPVFGINGSGMHTHQSLFKGNNNAFYDPKGEYQLSDIAFYYIGGLIEHAREMCAITNPLINSYKRLVPGYEAPTHIAWAEKNRSPLLRVPARRGRGTRVEFRMPDPSCNPYLALTVMLASGWDGVENRITPPPPVNKNIYRMSLRERRRYRIGELPGSLKEALDIFERSKLMKETLGEHIHYHFLDAKRQEWHNYIGFVHPWEINNYLGTY